MDIASQLETINQQYYEQEEAEKEEFIDQLMELHQEAMQDQDALMDFKQTAPYIAGGAYIPYLFWVELSQFLSDQPESRSYLQELIKAFVDSDFEEEEKNLLKPLMVVYFKNEKQFELDRVDSFLLRDAHPEVARFIKKAIEFVDVNKTAARTFEQKFQLLKPYFPNFELFQLSLQELQEQLQEDA